jgi:putative DNA primase/helicase
VGHEPLAFKHTDDDDRPAAGSSTHAGAGDYITKRTFVDMAPLGTPCPLWVSFLERITEHNAELRKFLQRYIGYCLTGLTHEHAFVFAHGTGGNGKGTFLNTIVGILGDYATVADTGTFVASRGERHPTDVAHLVGARLVVAQETQEGRQWNEARIKEMTGGDRMTARFMRQDYFDFEPTHKLFITGNHKPTLSTVDPAMKRRLLLVPFLAQITAEERDLELRDKLKAEWPAILRWCVSGCIDWQRVGLQPPAVVQDATAEYFSDEDTLGQWMDERLDLGDRSRLTSSRALFADWRPWCEDHGHRPGSQKDLVKKLKAKGLGHARTEKARGFYAKLVTRGDT